MTSFLRSEPEFERCRTCAGAALRLDASFPTQVFQPGYGRFAFEEFDVMMAEGSWPRLQALLRASGDATVLVGVLDPDPVGYYKREFGYYNWFTLPVDATSAEYQDALTHEPPESPADSIMINAETVIWIPASAKWALWGQRSVEIAVLGLRDDVNLGSAASSKWSVDEALDDLAWVAFGGGAAFDAFAAAFRASFGPSR